MGCMWSRESSEHCMHCNRKAVNNLVIIDHECEICIVKATSSQHSAQNRPKFGEYRCNHCGRYWNSHLCWPNKYQICKRCQKPVLPFKYRELYASDITELNENKQEHAQEFCQMCQQLGYPCKRFGKKFTSNNLRTKKTNSKYRKTAKMY